MLCEDEDGFLATEMWWARRGGEGGRVKKPPSHPSNPWLHPLDTGNRHTALKPCPCDPASGEKASRARGREGEEEGMHGLTEGQQRTAARRGSITAAPVVFF